MTLQEKTKRLSQLRSLRQEVDMLSQRIAELEQAAQGGTGRITGMPKTHWQSDRTGNLAVQITELAQRLEARRLRCMEMLGALYAFIDDIPDSRMRQIMTYRYIDGKTWQQVARLIGEMDEQYPRRLHNRFLESTAVEIKM